MNKAVLNKYWPLGLVIVAVLCLASMGLVVMLDSGKGKAQTAAADEALATEESRLLTATLDTALSLTPDATVTSTATHTPPTPDFADIPDQAGGCGPDMPLVQTRGLQIGDTVTVIVFQVSVRQEPGLEAPLARSKYLSRGRVFEIKGGPVCAPLSANGHIEWANWYYLDGDFQVYENGVPAGMLHIAGWVAEADYLDFYLKPIQ